MRVEERGPGDLAQWNPGFRRRQTGLRNKKLRHTQGLRIRVQEGPIQAKAQRWEKEITECGLNEVYTKIHSGKR